MSFALGHCLETRQMPKLYGRNWTPEELNARTGGLEQLAGVERVVLDDGSARGVRAAILRTGSGLEVQVLLDRALDLGRASFRGQPLACQAPCRPKLCPSSSQGTPTFWRPQVVSRPQPNVRSQFSQWPS